MTLTIKDKVHNWVMQHIPHPEALEPYDYAILDFMLTFFIETVPQVIALMLIFSLLSYMYLWGYRKYGLERTLIVLMVNIILAIGQVGKSVGQLTKAISHK